MPESSTAKVAREIGTSPASGTEIGASTQVTAAQKAQRTISYVVNFILSISSECLLVIGMLIDGEIIVNLI
jgi:hypothetical protein